MAMGKCPSCGKAISSNADSCPGCGETEFRAKRYVGLATCDKCHGKGKIWHVEETQGGIPTPSEELTRGSYKEGYVRCYQCDGKLKRRQYEEYDTRTGAVISRYQSNFGA